MADGKDPEDPSICHRPCPICHDESCNLALPAPRPPTRPPRGRTGNPSACPLPTGCPPEGTHRVGFGRDVAGPWAPTSAVREEGLEPSCLAAQEPKSCVSASSTTLATLRN